MGGYTGQLCVQQLDMLLSRPGSKHHRWAIAGRHKKKLELIRSKCKTKPGIFIASTHCEISKMCHETFVLLSAAGPYVKCGDVVINCCVSQWTHYIDFCGETRFLRACIDKYHEKAKKRNTMIVFAAGQECAPYDIVAYKLARKLGPMKFLRMYMFQYGFVSGGTALTGRVGMEQLADPENFRHNYDPFILGGMRKCGIRDVDQDMFTVEQDSLFPSLWVF